MTSHSHYKVCIEFKAYVFFHHLRGPFSFWILPPPSSLLIPRLASPPVTLPRSSSQISVRCQHNYLSHLLFSSFSNNCHKDHCPPRPPCPPYPPYPPYQSGVPPSTPCVSASLFLFCRRIRPSSIFDFRIPSTIFHSVATLPLAPCHAASPRMVHCKTGVRVCSSEVGMFPQIRGQVCESATVPLMGVLW